MLRIAVLGCGRIGQMHAANVARHPRAKLATVYDVHAPSAERVAAAQGVTAAANPEAVFASPDVDAVLIATATPTHADYIEMAVVFRRDRHHLDLLDQRPQRLLRLIHALGH